MKITIDGVLLAEADITNGRVPIKIIQTGWGSSGYYSEGLLKRDYMLFEGAQMYWNHPKSSDEWERPERDLNDFAAILREVTWQEQGIEGPGLYGVAEVFNRYLPIIEDIGQHIGISIRAIGQGSEGSAEGRDGMIVERFTEVRSVDFVTRAGAGGKVVSRFNEAASNKLTPLNILESEGQMDLKEALDTIQTQQTALTEAQGKIVTLETDIKTRDEKITALETSVSRYEEAAMVIKASEIVSEVLKESELPEVTQERIIKGASSLMVASDGKIDEEATKVAAQEAIKAEAKYLSEITGGAGVKGMGSKPISEAMSKEDHEAALVESFMAIGMSESKAKIAAAGKK